MNSIDHNLPFLGRIIIQSTFTKRFSFLFLTTNVLAFCLSTLQNNNVRNLNHLPLKERQEGVGEHVLGRPELEKLNWD